MSENVRDNRVAGVDCPLRNRPATATSVHRIVLPRLKRQSILLQFRYCTNLPHGTSVRRGDVRECTFEYTANLIRDRVKKPPVRLPPARISQSSHDIPIRSFASPARELRWMIAVPFGRQRLRAKNHDWTSSMSFARSCTSSIASLTTSVIGRVNRNVVRVNQYTRTTGDGSRY